MIKIVNVKYDKYDIYIGRTIYPFKGSKWQNPFKIGKDGTREEVLKKYEKRIKNSKLYDQLGELSGKVLGCWCVKKGGASDTDEIICHGQILAKLLKEKNLGE
jgi:hypothetical protein